MKIPREFRTWHNLAIQSGWEIVRSGSHLRWRSPAGVVVITGATPCRGTRTLLNARADLRRAGLPI